MARSFARIAVTRYTDPDWRHLTLEQQAVYDFLLTHPKLSICGALDVKLATWVNCFNGVSVERLSELLGQLESLDWICWDRDTDELAVRTFVRHDGVLQNKNSGKGMWSAWATIESEILRGYLVDNLEDLAFEERFEPPLSAIEIRRSIGRSNDCSDDRCDRSIELSVAQPQPQPDPSSAGGSNDRFTPSFMKGKP